MPETATPPVPETEADDPPVARTRQYGGNLRNLEFRDGRLVPAESKLQKRVEELKRKGEQLKDIGFLAASLKNAGVEQETERSVVSDLMVAFRQGIGPESLKAGGAQEVSKAADLASLTPAEKARIETVTASLVKLVKDRPDIKLTAEKINQIRNYLALSYQKKKEIPDSPKTPENPPANLPKAIEIKGQEKDAKYFGQEGAVVHFTPDNFDTLRKHILDNLYLLKNRNPNIPQYNVTRVFFDVPEEHFKEFIESRDSNPIINARREGRITAEESDFLLKNKNLYRVLANQGIVVSGVPIENRSSFLTKEIWQNYHSSGNKERSLLLLNDAHKENIEIEKDIFERSGPNSLGRAVVVKS